MGSDPLGQKFAVIDYTEQDRTFLLQAISALQFIEHQISPTTHRMPSDRLSQACLAELLFACLRKRGRILVAWRDNIRLGFVSYHEERTTFECETEDSNHFLMVSQICIMPEFHHMGMGQRLLSAVETEARSSGFKGKMRLLALANNQLAIQAYQRFGMHVHEITFEKIIGNAPP
jgi:ribosomal protein S18 acetylase RimI-like enzyme